MQYVGQTGRSLKTRFREHFRKMKKPKKIDTFLYRHLKQGIQDFHMNYVLVPADKAANNVVVV